MRYAIQCTTLLTNFSISSIELKQQYLSSRPSCVIHCYQFQVSQFPFWNCFLKHMSKGGKKRGGALSSTVGSGERGKDLTDEITWSYPTKLLVSFLNVLHTSSGKLVYLKHFPCSCSMSLHNKPRWLQMRCTSLSPSLHIWNLQLFCLLNQKFYFFYETHYTWTRDSGWMHVLYDYMLTWLNPKLQN